MHLQLGLHPLTSNKETKMELDLKPKYIWTVEVDGRVHRFTTRSEAREFIRAAQSSSDSVSYTATRAAVGSDETVARL